MQVIKLFTSNSSIIFPNSRYPSRESASADIIVELEVFPYRTEIFIATNIILINGSFREKIIIILSIGLCSSMLNDSKLPPSSFVSARFLMNC